MSAPFPTRPAFIHHGCWCPITRSHPALAFLEEYAASHFDARAWDTAHFSEWHHEGWELTKPDTSKVYGGHEAWTEGIPSIYGGFKGHKHVPTFFVVWEMDGGEGWELIGEANVFMDFSEGGNGQGEPVKVQDLSGKEWDTVMRGSFHFEFVKAEGGGDNKHGLVLKASHIFAETRFNK